MEPDNEVDCTEAVHRLYHYLDGELTEHRRAVIQMHLDACHHCLEAFEFEYILRRTIASRCRDEVPQSLIAKVAAAIAHESGTPRPPSTFT
jgi:mycothiol system anti-sigma-R factor